MSEVVQLRTQADRQRFLGGSDAAAVLGVSPWGTRLDCYLEKRGESVREVDPAREKLYRRGKRLEPVVIEMMVEEYRLKVTKVSTPANPNRYVDPEHPFLAAEIDFEWEVTQADIERWNLDPSLLGTIQSGEIKTVHHFAGAKFGEAETEEVPIEYAAQAMHGLMVTGRKLTLFGVLLGADDLTPYFVHRDDETIAAMRPKLVSFWRDHVLAGVPPEPVNLPDVLKLFRKLPSSQVEATPEILAACEELQRAKDEAAAAEDRQVEAKFQIGKFMLGETGILLGNKGELKPTPATKPGEHLLLRNGEPILKVGLQSQNRIDSDKVRSDYPEVAIACNRSISFFKFERPRAKRR